MSHFHCLHGAWHGAWVWQDLQQLLAPEHTVFAPDLPGLGADCGNINASIGLEDHIEAAMLQQPGVLVAHSYAGMLARALADRQSNMIKHIVLIEALWPDHNQCALDLLPESARSAIEKDIETAGHGWQIPPPDADRFDISDEDLRRKLESRLTGQPAMTYRQRLQLSGDSQAGTYVIATDRAIQPYQSTVERLRQRGWHVIELAGGHELMLTQTEAIARVLRNVVKDHA